MKYILALFILMGLGLNSINGQSDAVMAKSYFLKAQEAYSNGENSVALEQLDKTLEYLNSTNAKVEALYVKISIHQKKYLTAKKHLDTYFEKAGETRSDYLEMVSYAAELNDKLNAIIESGIDIQFVETAIFSGGSFWGVEYFLKDAPGVFYTEVGYTGGQKENPTWKEVSSSNEGHAQSVKIFYDNRTTSFEHLAKFFFEIHDPTQKNRQGSDIGSAFRSGIFYFNKEQKEIAEQLKAKLESRGLNVTTEITQAAIFWPAEEYHQDYYLKKDKEPCCRKHIKIF